MTTDTHHHHQCWSRTPQYRPGGRLTAEQLNAAQADAVRRDRLVNIAMHGIGVAYGFDIAVDAEGRMVVEDGCIHIGCGLAFDRHGRMLFWRGGPLSVAGLVGPRPHCEGPHTLRVHYAETREGGDCFDPCREGLDWVERCVAFTLVPGCEPHDPCAPDAPEDACMTRREWICTRNGFGPGDVPADAALEHACADPPPLAASDCGRVDYDTEAGLPLACVEICDLDRDKQDCHPRYGFCPCGRIDACKVRPVAYRSRLLYELINLDDVPVAKIARYSWSDWELTTWSDAARVPFEAFRQRAKACQQEPVDPWQGFSVMFTRPVQRRTLHPMSVIMEIYILETRANYWEPWRIPTYVHHLDRDGRVIHEETEEDCVWGVMLCPEADWIQYEIDDPKSTILDCANKGRLARVEITVRGQIVRDCCGLMIDARPPDIDVGDLCGNRAGQARAGDDFLSCFRVGEDYSHEDYADPGKESRGYRGPGQRAYPEYRPEQEPGGSSAQGWDAPKTPKKDPDGDSGGARPYGGPYGRSET